MNRTKGFREKIEMDQVYEILLCALGTLIMFHLEQVIHTINPLDRLFIFIFYRENESTLQGLSNLRNHMLINGQPICPNSVFH